MRVIPVIDLMRGQVVRGVGGRRDEYRPIASKLATDAKPATVGRALADSGFREAYVADLDAIGGAEPSWNVYDALLDRGMALLVDAGLSTVERASAMARFETGGRRLAGIVAGLESLASAHDLREVCRVAGPERLAFSLDLKQGRPLSRVPEWRDMTPLALASMAWRAGVRRMIVLDLADVGMGRGPATLPLCRELRSLDPKVEIIAGGGVRGDDDLRALASAGCDGALVASALHDGRLSAEKCAAMR